MASTISTIAGAFFAFMTWWGRELAGMLPPWLFDRGDGGATRNVVAVVPGGFRLAGRVAAGGEASVGTRDGVVPAAVVAQRLRDATPDGRRAALRFPSDDCFIRTVELPTSAAGDFGQLLDLDMERATPFQRGDVWTAFTPLPAGPGQAAGRTAFQHFIVKRSLLAPAIADLQRAGVEIERLECWIDGSARALPMDFLTASGSNTARPRSLARLILAAAAIAVLLAGNAANTYLARLQASLATLEDQVRPLREAVARKREADAGARSVDAALTALQTLNSTTVPKLAVIDELTRVLPDTAWLSDLRISTDRTDFDGYAASTVSLFPLLEKSALFVDATSTSAVTFDPRVDKERFSLHVRLRLGNPAKVFNAVHK